MQPSTLAYVARLLIHRYEMLGVLDAAGYPTAGSAMLWSDAPAPGAAPVPVDRADLPGMRPPDADPPRRLRLLHLLRARRAPAADRAARGRGGFVEAESSLAWQWLTAFC